MAKEFDLGYIKGPAGPAGPSGPTGPAGPVGATPHITVGNTFTLAAGEPAAVTVRAGSPAAAPVLDFGIPAGGGDMDATVYDPTNKHQDIFAYAVSHGGRRPATVVVAAADSAGKAQADLVCDGESDQLVLSEALNSLPPGGGSILLQEGTYHLDTYGVPASGTSYPLLTAVRANTLIRGMGPATVLKLDDNVGEDGYTYNLLCIAAANVRVCDLLLDGNSAGNGEGTVNGLTLTAAAANGSVRGCTVRNCSGAAISCAADGVAVRDCFCAEGGSGVVISGCSVSVDGSRISGMAAYGVFASGGQQLISGCRISDCRAVGILLDGTYRDLVSGNILIGQPVGMRLQYANGSQVMNNAVIRDADENAYEYGEYSVFLLECSGVAVIANRLPGKSAVTSGGSDNVKAFSGSDWNLSV